jgi:hypothetical protein
MVNISRTDRLLPPKKSDITPLDMHAQVPVLVEGWVVESLNYYV